MSASQVSARPSAARERLLTTASRLFYKEGIHTVGIDRVIAEAGVTRATFYRHFPAKQDLVVAYIQRRDEQIRSVVAEAFKLPLKPREMLALLMRGIADEVCGTGFRGCPFINAAAEYPDSDHPVRQAIRAHRDWFRQTIHNLVAASGHPEPDRATQLLVSFRDGAMAGGYLDDPQAASDSLTSVVDMVLAG
ncbi:TetR/AcrR family transcriptional regulator [Streptomyces sp. NBC_01476]|uniref:TetR/AcrR family transcriptional regulator n=1 Tax=Streptomyces sp. NBC_01476 TaxID=2903881 RepID=UPI002E368DC4|nr:TetR/AcrR family transcriptional regulator [Streptomyces sp. NBC_01476]